MPTFVPLFFPCGNLLTNNPLLHAPSLGRRTASHKPHCHGTSFPVQPSHRPSDLSRRKENRLVRPPLGAPIPWRDHSAKLESSDHQINKTDPIHPPLTTGNRSDAFLRVVAVRPAAFWHNLSDADGKQQLLLPPWNGYGQLPRRITNLEQAPRLDQSAWSPPDGKMLPLFSSPRFRARVRNKIARSSACPAALPAAKVGADPPPS